MLRQSWLRSRLPTLEREGRRCALGGGMAMAALAGAAARASSMLRLGGMAEAPSVANALCLDAGNGRATRARANSLRCMARPRSAAQDDALRRRLGETKKEATARLTARLRLETLRRSSKGSSLAACDLCFPFSNAAGGPPTTRLTRLGGRGLFTLRGPARTARILPESGPPRSRQVRCPGCDACARGACPRISRVA